MQAFLTLVRREIGGYFTSFTGYTVLAVVLLLIGLSFYSIVYLLNGAPTPIPVTEMYYQTQYFWLILLLAAPVITMRTFAREKDAGTFETLMTAPVSDHQVVGSKFVGSMIFYVMIWLPLLACTLILRSIGGAAAAFDFGMLASTGLGIVLIGCVYISMGVFASSLTKSQVTAAMVSFALGVGLFMASFLGSDFSGTDSVLAKAVRVIDLKSYMQDFAAGIVDTPSGHLLPFAHGVVFVSHAAGGREPPLEVVPMSDPSSFSPSRKWGIALNVALGVIAFFALVAMFNYLSARHHQRFHWSSRADVELTARTTSLLNAMTNAVEITVFFDKQSELFTSLSRLLEEYEANSGSLQIEVIDMYRDPVAAQQAKVRFDIDPEIDDNLVIVSHAERKQVLTEKSLWSFDYEQVALGDQQEYRKHYRSFQGELLITSAIADVISPRQVKAYYVQGHEEHDPTRTEAQMGYSGFHGLIAENNIALATINLLRSEIPEDCDLLLLMGPQRPLQPVELDRIEQYLNQGGRMMIGFNYRAAQTFTGLETLLGQWGVVVGMNLIEDTDRQVSGNGQSSARFGAHPISGPLFGIDLLTVYPRTIAEYRDAPPGQIQADVSELVFTGTNAVVYTRFNDEGLPVSTGLDERTEFPIAVAVEKGGVPGVATARGGVTRIVVMGDSFMFSNLILNQQANRDFANQVINWLVDRSELMTGIGPRPMQEYQLTLMPGQMKTVRLILVGGYADVCPGSRCGGLVATEKIDRLRRVEQETDMVVGGCGGVAVPLHRFCRAKGRQRTRGAVRINAVGARHASRAGDLAGDSGDRQGSDPVW